MFSIENKHLLQRFEDALIEFLFCNLEFYNDLLLIVYKYSEERFVKFERYSYNYRLLFRLICNRLWDSDYDKSTLLSDMKKDLECLYNKHVNTYDSFAKLLKLHIDKQSNGYTWAVRIMLGFSVKEFLENNLDLYYKRKRIFFNFFRLLER